MLTAVAGGSSVAAVGAVTVEGAPRLRAFTAVFTVAGGAPGETHTDRKREACSQSELNSQLDLSSQSAGHQKKIKKNFRK